MQHSSFSSKAKNSETTTKTQIKNHSNKNQTKLIKPTSTDNLGESVSLRREKEKERSTGGLGF